MLHLAAGILKGLVLCWGGGGGHWAILTRLLGRSRRTLLRAASPGGWRYTRWRLWSWTGILSCTLFSSYKDGVVQLFYPFSLHLQPNFKRKSTSTKDVENLKSTTKNAVYLQSKMSSNMNSFSMQKLFDYTLIIKESWHPSPFNYKLLEWLSI